ncbi:MAG: hypothetical protein ACD_28C00004G0014 [uncultured bacterium]|nr:MAG: hypothetical protein ACD_28C00004G0014 [uncultured bacterium]
MKNVHANTSILAILILVMMIGGVTYLFWQNTELQKNVLKATPLETTLQEKNGSL